MRSILLIGVALAAAAAGLAFLPAAPEPATAPVPKTVILGFDGMDFALTQRWMEAGQLPNFQRLAERGLFQPLQTSNPAQSPVSWAVFNTGCNPGKTGVAGFVSRFFSASTPTQPGRPLPQQMLGFPTRIPADSFVAFPMALKQRTAFLFCAGGVGLLAGLVLGLLLRLLLRVPVLVVLLVCALGAGGTTWWAARWTAGLPADGMLPYVINPMQGTSFWSYLDGIGVRTRGVQVASTYPPDDEGPETHLLSGLGVMDVSGSPGSWCVYTSSKWVWQDKKTDTAGRVIRLYEDEPGRLDARLFGPTNWIQQAGFEGRLQELRARREQAGLSEAELQAIDAQIAGINAEFTQWRNSGDNKQTTVPFSMRLDKAAHAVDFTVAGRSFRVEQGGWSDMIPVQFVLNAQYSARGLATFHVMRCGDDEEGTRVLVPPINIDPLDPPRQMPISAPPAFAADLQHEIGHAYETLGWACITNPLKDIEDSQISQQSFMDDMVSTEALREDLLAASLERADDWDVYFQVFSTPDRVGHMLFREFDEGHPKHDSTLANTEVHAFGQTFPLKEAILQVYRNADRIVGRVLEQLDAGALGPDCLLLIVSDHGFSSFRRQVNLNNVLHELGYLVFRNGADGRPLDVPAIRESSAGVRDLLGYADWSRTRAYSMGLGEVFINLRGREPQGIVPPEEYDAVVEQIRADLLELKDPQGGASVVTSVSRRDELYSGPWWREGKAQRKVFRKMEEVKHDGFADLFLGYAPFYRVAWSNTLGNVDSAAITDNDNHWSGDHVSVDPRHVPGVLFSNRKLGAPAEAGLMDIAPTVLRRYGLDPTPPHTEMDGHSLPFENLTR